MAGEVIEPLGILRDHKKAQFNAPGQSGMHQTRQSGSSAPPARTGPSRPVLGQGLRALSVAEKPAGGHRGRRVRRGAQKCIELGGSVHGLRLLIPVLQQEEDFYEVAATMNTHWQQVIVVHVEGQEQHLGLQSYAAVTCINATTYTRLRL